MVIAEFTSNHSTMGSTRTYEDFSKWLGTKPHRLGLISSLYSDNTITYITEALQNIFYNGTKANNKYQSINSMYFEWETKTNEIKRIPFAATPTSDGADGAEIVMAFQEKYYDKYDTFTIDDSGQQCFVVSAPIRKNDHYWELRVRLIDNDYSSILDKSACQVGSTTHFVSNAVPELHEEGHTKYQSNVSKHRNYITTHRVDDDWSALYAAQENVFIKIGEGKSEDALSTKTYIMKEKEKDLLDNFMWVRNSGLLFSKTNVDINGKSTICDTDTGRSIYIGDGVIPQVERFASKYAFAKLNESVFQTVMATMGQKSMKSTGNTWVFICNQRFWNLVQTSLLGYLAKFKATGDGLLWSQKANGYVSVGNTFDCYEYGGNKLMFKCDKAFSNEYGYDKGYCMVIDLTADLTADHAPIAMFTLNNGDFISNKLEGVGGMDGLSSGPVASPVAGSKLIYWGYSGVCVFSPYQSFILREI